MNDKTTNIFTWLALGDSYTIGEQVPIHESFPYQALKLLRQTAVGAESRHQAFSAPEIVAKTGWTTDELNDHINQNIYNESYDLVTLLIGVNNQYRGRSWYEFKLEFMHLLQRAIRFANNQPANVYVLSIPDWGVTPFAKERDTERIAIEIDKYNEQCKLVAEEYNCHYIDITPAQRQEGNNPEFLAPDQLHPNGNEYAKWARELASRVMVNFKTG